MPKNNTNKLDAVIIKEYLERKIEYNKQMIAKYEELIKSNPSLKKRYEYFICQHEQVALALDNIMIWINEGVFDWKEDR